MSEENSYRPQSDGAKMQQKTKMEALSKIIADANKSNDCY